MTDVYVAGRAAGKTHDLILRLADDGRALMVCTSRQSADDAKRMAHDLGLGESVTKRIITTHELRRSMGGLIRPSVTLLVDNAEVLLSYFLGFPVGAMSVTGQVVETSASRGVVTS